MQYTTGEMCYILRRIDATTDLEYFKTCLFDSSTGISYEMQTDFVVLVDYSEILSVYCWLVGVSLLITFGGS